MRRVKHNNISGVGNNTTLQGSPCQIGVLAEYPELFIESADSFENITPIKHVCGHESQALEIHVGHGAIAWISKMCTSNTAFESNYRICVEIARSFLQPVAFWETVIIGECDDCARSLFPPLVARDCHASFFRIQV